MTERIATGWFLTTCVGWQAPRLRFACRSDVGWLVVAGVTRRSLDLGYQREAEGANWTSAGSVSGVEGSVQWLIAGVQATGMGDRNSG